MCADVRNRIIDDKTRATGRLSAPPTAQEVSGPRVSRALERKRRIGEYQIVAMIGEGGMAQVHLALKHGPAGFTKLLVVKSLKDHLVDPIYARSFMHEARVAAQLNHSNVVQTYEVGEDEGRLFIAMEYVEGQSMRAVQRRMAPNRLPLSVQLRILAELARGLHHAHTLKSFDGQPLRIVHRDVSPQNVMLTYDGQVKLLDFGIAKASSSEELTRAGMIKGKIDYMAPEQLRGLDLDHRADIFPLGVMLWEALAGMRFSGGAEVAEVTKMHNRVVGAEANLRVVAPETPMRLVEICERAIALTPSDRYESAEAFGQALTEYLAETSKMTGPKHLAKIVEALFAREHKETRDLIEQQIRMINAPDYIDVIAPVPFTPQAGEDTGTPRAPLERLLHDIEHTEITSGAPEDEDDGLFGSARARRTTAIAAVALLAITGAFFALRSTWYSPGDASAAQTAESRASDSAPASAALPAPAAAGSAVHIRIEATPPSAIAELDGVRIALPFDARLGADLRLHRVVVHASGYETAERGFALENDSVLHLDLVPVADDELLPEDDAPTPRTGRGRRAARARARAAARAAPAPAATRARPTSPLARPTTARRSPAIDSSNPYQ